MYLIKEIELREIPLVLFNSFDDWSQYEMCPNVWTLVYVVN